MWSTKNIWSSLSYWKHVHIKLPAMRIFNYKILRRFTIFLRLIAILLVLRLSEALAWLVVFSGLYVSTTTLISTLMISWCLLPTFVVPSILIFKIKASYSKTHPPRKSPILTTERVKHLEAVFKQNAGDNATMDLQ